MMKIYFEVERFDGAMIETRGSEGTEQENEEYILKTAVAFGTVHVLDDRGRRVRTITPADASQALEDLA